MKAFLSKMIFFSVAFFASALASSSEQTIKVSVLSLFKPKLVWIASQNKTWKIEISENNVLVNGEKQAFFQTNDLLTFTIEIPGKIKRSYYGNIEAYPQEQTLLLVNEVRMNDYLESVVSSEMGNAGLEALKAQAVLSRTLAFKTIQEESSHPYHVTDLTDSQVYKGKTKPHKKASQAISETSQLVLKYQGQLPLIFFSSTCGGKTTTPEWVWGKEVPGYRSVDCSIAKEALCAHSPHFYWSWKVTLEELETIFKISLLKTLVISETDPSGRAAFLNLISQSGQIIKISSSEFHRMIGKHYRNWGLIKSAFFQIKQEENLVIFLGKGLGHGIGLCQYGAKKLSDKNYSFRSILNFYFPDFNVDSF